MVENVVDRNDLDYCNLEKPLIIKDSYFSRLSNQASLNMCRLTWGFRLYRNYSRETFSGDNC